MDGDFRHLDYTAFFSSARVLGDSWKIPYGDRNREGREGTLHLDSNCDLLVDGFYSKGVKTKQDVVTGCQEDAFLALGLGCSSSCSDISKGCSGTCCTMSPAKETDDGASTNIGLSCQLRLGREDAFVHTKSPASSLESLKHCSLDLQLSLTTVSPESVVTSTTPDSAQPHKDMDMSPTIFSTNIPVPPMNDRPMTSCWDLGKFSKPSTYLGTSERFLLDQYVPARADSVTVIADGTSAKRDDRNSPVTCSSGVTNLHQRTSTKTCSFQGCEKGARGASGLCIAHGGGRRCQKVGCNKGAEGRTIYCKAHGGGRRCQILGCTKSAEGRTDYCIAHGGGRRCSHEGCSKAARGRSGLCIRHGGGKRCQVESCTKSAEGSSGFCISHGGGRRCQFPECTKGAQGSTKYCKAHGGGKRCMTLGCTKGAEGSTPFCKGHGGGKRCSFGGGGVCPKSVHGGTQFCVAHGGGKRCAAPDCSRSARGRTNFCVRHGGGKRCKFDGCGKSAQGSTDFCKAHGGGKRCVWGQPGSRFGAEESPCERFARGKTGLCAAHSALVQDQCVHGAGTIGPSSFQNVALTRPDGAKDCVISLYPYVGGQTLVLAKPYSGKEHNIGLNTSISNVGAPPMETLEGRSCSEQKYTDGQHVSISLPEGRVHGGRLMSMLVNNVGCQ